MNPLEINLECPESIAYKIEREIKQNNLEAEIHISSFRYDSFEIPQIDVNATLTIVTNNVGTLSSIVIAIFQCLTYFNKNKGEITISLGNSYQIKIPANTPKEKIEEYIKKAKEAQQLANDDDKPPLIY